MLETKRFLLRKLNINDAENMFKNWVTDEKVTKYLTWNPHKDINETISYINLMLDTNAHHFGIIDKQNNEIIGTIANVFESADYSYCEVGYCLSRAYWNQGVMTEVLDKYLEDLFYRHNYKLVKARHLKANRASGAVLLKCGFKRAFIDDELTDKWGVEDVIFYSITKEEFEINRIVKNVYQRTNLKLYPASTIDDLLLRLRLSNAAYLEVSLIKSDKIKEIDSSDVALIKNNEGNINKYYFVSSVINEGKMQRLVNEFIQLNNRYFISINDKKIEKVLVDLLRKHSLHISFAESCTGGLMAATLINVAGASNVINESIVAYHENSKIKLLGVDPLTIANHSVYSKEVALEMVNGLYNITKAEVCVSITGRAGGEKREIADGSYDFAVVLHKGMDKREYAFHKEEKGTRNEVRRSQTNYCFFTIINLILDYFENTEA